MISVIADDFTGAAEMAGIGLRFNLKAELSVAGGVDTKADLLVVSTDSRSMETEDARKITADTVTGMLLLKPVLLFKKIDSVLRGHVVDELRTQMQQLGLQKGLIIAGNPSLGRTIRDGRYFIDGVPAHETGFATDPEFAIKDASVLSMMGVKQGDVTILRHADPLPDKGIVLGEVNSVADVAAWAERVDNTWALAGAGDFFAELLRKKYSEQPRKKISLELPFLYVSGTAFEKNASFIKGADRKSKLVKYLPAEMMQTGEIDEDWLKDVQDVLDAKKKLIIAIDSDVKKKIDATAASLRTTMARAVREIVEKGNVREMFIEGGSTSAAILHALGIVKLPLVDEISRGVVRTKVGELYITVKPGSYGLPLQIIELFN
jgi:D-threonate/D-erythronate kinase